MSTLGLDWVRAGVGEMVGLDWVGIGWVLGGAGFLVGVAWNYQVKVELLEGAAGGDLYLRRAGFQSRRYREELALYLPCICSVFALYLLCIFVYGVIKLCLGPPIVVKCRHDLGGGKSFTW